MLFGWVGKSRTKLKGRELEFYYKLKSKDISLKFSIGRQTLFLPCAT